MEVRTGLTKIPCGSLGLVDYLAGQVRYFTLLNLLHVIS